LICLASALLLDIAHAQNLPLLEFAGTVLFRAGLGATTVNLILFPLHAGRRRRRRLFCLQGNLQFHS
jgi:hypothetical protein